MSEGQTGKRIKISLWMLLVPFLFLFAGLGVWQLNRAEEKRDVLTAWGEPTETISELRLESLKQFSSVRLEGVFDAESVFLLDNRTRQGKVGYEVLALFYPNGSEAGVLINLGWTLADSDRNRLPHIELPMHTVTLMGRLFEITPMFTLGEDVWRLDWPKRIQQIDVPRIERLAGVPVHDWQVRLDEPLIVGLRTEWQVTAMPPEKHIAYAIQWFALAAVLVVWMGWYYGWQTAQGGKHGT